MIRKFEKQFTPLLHLTLINCSNVCISAAQKMKGVAALV